MDRYIKVYEWMRELGLKPGELLAFAVVYSFGKYGDWYTGSASYLASWIGVKKKDAVFRYLSRLIEKGLLEKRERWEKGQHLCDYRPTPKGGRGDPKKGPGGDPKKWSGADPKKGFHNNRPDSNRPDSDSDKKKYIYKEGVVQLPLDEFRKTLR